MTQILYLNYKFWCWNQFWSSESPLNIIFEHANRYNSFFWKVLIINFFMMSSPSQNRKIHLLIFFSTIDKVMHVYCKKAVVREYLVFFDENMRMKNRDYHLIYLGLELWRFFCFLNDYYEFKCPKLNTTCCWPNII